MTRSGSVENKLKAMAYNFFGLIPVVLTNRAAPSSQKLSILCFDGIEKRPNATFTCQMFLCIVVIGMIASLRGSQLFWRVDGLLVAGRFKSLLPRHRSSSSPQRG